MRGRARRISFFSQHLDGSPALLRLPLAKIPMANKLKPLDQQVIVITGASSGIGLCTALLAAERGAKRVLAARNEQTLGTERP